MTDFLNKIINIAKSAQSDRIISQAAKEKRDRLLPSFTTYQGIDPKDGTDKVMINGETNSGFNLISNAPLSIGERVFLHPNQSGGLQRVDARNVAPVVSVPAAAKPTSPIKLLLVKDGDLYIGGDREPELIFTGYTGAFDARIKSTGAGLGDYVINFAQNSSGGTYDFYSIKNGVETFKSVDLTWDFTADVLDQDDNTISESFSGYSYFNFENDFALVVSFASYGLENYDGALHDGDFIGYKNSTYFGRTQYVDIVGDTTDVITSSVSVALLNNGEDSNSVTGLEIPLSASKIVDGRLVIFTSGSLPNDMYLSGGTDDGIFTSTFPDRNSVLMHSYETFEGRLYSGSELPLLYSYPSGDLPPTSQYLNILSATKFTQLKELFPDESKADIYQGTLGSSIVYGSPVSVDYIPPDDTFTLLDASVFL